MAALTNRGEKENNYMVIKFLRVGLTMLLIGLVWRHAHWSVALTLTLITLNIEIILKHFEKLRHYKAERGLREYNLFKKIKRLTGRTDELGKQILYVNRQLASQRSAPTQKVMDPKPSSSGQQ